MCFQTLVQEQLDSNITEQRAAQTTRLFALLLLYIASNMFHNRIITAKTHTQNQTTIWRVEIFNTFVSRDQNQQRNNSLLQSVARWLYVLSVTHAWKMLAYSQQPHLQREQNILIVVETNVGAQTHESGKHLPKRLNSCHRETLRQQALYSKAGFWINQTHNLLTCIFSTSRRYFHDQLLLYYSYWQLITPDNA